MSAVIPFPRAQQEVKPMSEAVTSIPSNAEWSETLLPHVRVAAILCSGDVSAHALRESMGRERIQDTLEGLLAVQVRLVDMVEFVSEASERVFRLLEPQPQGAVIPFRRAAH